MRGGEAFPPPLPEFKANGPLRGGALGGQVHEERVRMGHFTFPSLLASLLTTPAGWQGRRWWWSRGHVCRGPAAFSV